jgi:histone acetyltransferase (RNA polymerase elongator complex component)
VKALKHFTIPVFIPQLACPFQCIYCNQRNISGCQNKPSEVEIIKIIEQHLATIPAINSHIEIGFFGGNFTGIPILEQENYLKLIQSYIENGTVKGIRLSTRPDYINETVLKLLKKYHVSTIELGAQSMDEDVLQLSGRGHNAEEIVRASKMIKANGFSLGLQMMLGLPGDTLGKAMATAKKIVALKADNTRIYPTLVIKDTELEILYTEKKYNPLSLEQAVEWAKDVYKLFDEANVTVLRMGLHPSEGLISGESLIAGPFHVSFGELVMTALWRDALMELLHKEKKNEINIFVSPAQLNYAIGYNASNKKMLFSLFKKVKFTPDSSIVKRNFHADYC